MCVNHSRLQFFSLIAPARVLASGVDANAAMAGTMAARTESNGASASPALVRNSSPSVTGERGLVDGTRAAVDPDRGSQALRSLSTTTMPRGFVSPTRVPAAGGSATPGEQLGQVATPAAPGGTASPTESPGICVGVRRLVGDRSWVWSADKRHGRIGEDHDRPDGLRTGRLDGGIPVTIRLSAGHAPAPLPAKAKPAATTLPHSTPPSATPLVATTSTATSPVATGSVATDPVATRSHEPSSDPVSSVMLVARFSLEHATCRSTLLAS
jgi:hypothetical protein